MKPDPKREPAITVNTELQTKHKHLAEDFVRSPTNYDRNAVSQATALECKDPSRTQQQFADEVDINFIADRYGLTGEAPQIPDAWSWGGDFDGVFDFQTAQNALIEAKAKFMTLPAKTRARFQNDPAQLLAFMDNLADPETRREAEFLGLVNPRDTGNPEGVKAAAESLQGDPGASQKVTKGSPTPKSDPKARQEDPPKNQN